MAAAGKVSTSYATIAAAALVAAVCCMTTAFAVAQQSKAPGASGVTPKPQSGAQKKPAGKAAKKPAPVAPAAKPDAKPNASPSAKAAPQPLAKSAPVAPAAKLPPLAPVDTSTPPPTLPRASRERMRSCAEEWEKKKRAASTGLPMWRDFAADCLTRR